MKKGINFLKIVILAGIIMAGGTACMENSKEIETPSNATRATQTPEESSSSETIATLDQQIVADIYTDFYGYKGSERDVLNRADSAMARAEKLSDQYLGRITSEEDAKEKAEVAWSKIDEFKNAKNKKPYEAKFYEKYDAWVVKGSLPPGGTTADGKQYGTLGNEPFIIIQQSDGKVLATWWG